MLQRRDARENTTLKNGEKPITNPHVVLREEFDDWAVLYDPDTGHGFGLSPTGVFVWKLVDGKRTLDALLEKIRKHAENVPEGAREHIEIFVNELVAHGLAGSGNSEVGPGSGLETSSSFSSGALNRVTPFSYEPPRLVNLGGSAHTAYGNCMEGSSPSDGNCQSGGAAGTVCCSGSGPYTTYPLCQACNAGDFVLCSEEGTCVPGGIVCSEGNHAGGGTWCSSGSVVGYC